MKLLSMPKVAKSSVPAKSNSGQPLSKFRVPLVPGILRTSRPVFVPKPGCSEDVPWRAHPKGASMTELGDRKSTRLNSSHGYISYAVFWLKKKNADDSEQTRPAVQSAPQTLL